MPCRTGCATQDHGSWGECVRAANISLPMNTIKAFAHGAVTQQQFQADNDFYRSAIRQGVQPAGSSRAHVQAALEVSNKTGKAFRADKRAGR